MRLARARLAIEDAIIHLRQLDDDVSRQGVDLESIRVRLTLLEDKILAVTAADDYCFVCGNELKAGDGKKNIKSRHRRDCLMRSVIR